MLQAKRCKQCQRFFKPGNDLQKYCIKCRGNVKYYVPKKKQYVKCKQCGITIETGRKNQRFCSDRCRYTYHSKAKLHKRYCVRCKKPYWSTVANKKYCSRNCYYEEKLEREHKRYINAR